MALVRVYCGVATAEMAPWLTVAVVDDAGRLLDMRHISDDPAGYAYLVTLLAERSGGSCPVAIDRHEHLVAQLLAAANRPLAIADEMILHDLTERFSDDSSYDEVQAPLSQRHAIGLARALQAGALYATAQSPSWDLDELKPLLSAHAAVVAGRQAAAVALREVLREIYPAALRAYLDPAEFIPAQDPRCVPRAGTAGWLAVDAEPGIGRRRRADRERRHRHRHCHERDHRAARGGGGVARLERQPSGRVRSGGDGPAGRRRGACLLTRPWRRWWAVWASGSMRSPAAMPTRVVHPAAAPVSPAVPRRANAAPAAEVPPSRIAPRASAASAAAAGLGVSAGVGTATAYGIPAPRPEPSFPSGYGSADYSAYSTGSAFGWRAPALSYGASNGSAYDPYDRGTPNGSSHGSGNGSSYGSDNGSPYGSANGAVRLGNGSPYGPGNGSPHGSGNGSPFGSSNGSGWEQQYGSPPSYGPDTLSFSLDPLTAPLSPPDLRTPRADPGCSTGRRTAPRRRPVDLLAGQLGVVHQRRRPRRTDVQLGRSVRRRLARGRDNSPCPASDRRPRPAYRVGCPRPTWCPARLRRRPSRCESFVTRRASPLTPRATSAVGDVARRSAGSPSVSVTGPLGSSTANSAPARVRPGCRDDRCGRPTRAT